MLFVVVCIIQVFKTAKKKGKSEFSVPEISGLGFPKIPDQLLSLYPSHQATSRKGDQINKKVRSTYHYY
jgi:hypothetical protein